MPTSLTSHDLSVRAKAQPDVAKTVNQCGAPAGRCATARPIGRPCKDEQARLCVQRPDPAKWSAALAVCAVQATQGLRPPLKLHRWATPTVCESIRLLALAASRRTDSVAAKPRPHARRVRVTTLSPGVLEAAVVINEGDKVHAVAIRLHWRRDVWYATELTLL